MRNLIGKSLILLLLTAKLSNAQIIINPTGGGGGGGGGAPTDATYITQVPDGTLSAEQALSLLATGLMQVTTTTGVVSSVTTSAGIASLLSDETGTGALVFANTPTLVTPILGTPTSGTLTNATGLPISTGVSGLAAGIATFLGTSSSANLASAITDETGTGSLVFGTNPTVSQFVIATGNNLTNLLISGGSDTGAASTSHVIENGTWNTSGNPAYHSIAVTETAKGATSRYFQILGGVGAATDEFYVQTGGSVFLLGKLGIGTAPDASKDIKLSGGSFIYDNGTASLNMFAIGGIYNFYNAGGSALRAVFSSSGGANNTTVTLNKANSVAGFFLDYTGAVTLTPDSGITGLTVTTGSGSKIAADQYIATGTAPSVSNTSSNSCGTTAATLAGTDETGVITVGATAGTNCTITFVKAAPTRRQCVPTNETTANLARWTYLTTTTGTVEGTFAAADQVSYTCRVY